MIWIGLVIGLGRLILPPASLNKLSKKDSYCYIEQVIEKVSIQEK